MTPTTPSPISDQAAGELLPCPFCGEAVTFAPFKRDGLTIKCKACVIEYKQRTIRFDLDWLAQKMAAHWNRRSAAPTAVISDQAGAAVGEPDLLKEIAQRLTVMLMSAKCYIDPSDDDVVIGYRIKTGALHQIIGMLECAGYRVSIPSNLPAEDGRGYVGIEPAKTLSTAPTTGSAPVAMDAMTFGCYLIDHCEDEYVSEESVQTWLSSAAKDPQYAKPASPAASALTDEQIDTAATHIWDHFGPDHEMEWKEAANKDTYRSAARVALLAASMGGDRT